MNTYTVTHSTPTTHGRNVTPGTSTRYFDWSLASETAMSAHARYAPIRDEYGTPAREEAFELWLEACAEESAAYQRYANTNLNV